MAICSKVSTQIIQSGVYSVSYKDPVLDSEVISLVSSAMVLGGLLSISFLQLPTIRNNMRREAEEKHTGIMEARIRIENFETFTGMARESPIFAERSN